MPQHQSETTYSHFTFNFSCSIMLHYVLESSLHIHSLCDCSLMFSSVDRKKSWTTLWQCNNFFHMSSMVEFELATQPVIHNLHTHPFRRYPWDNPCPYPWAYPCVVIFPHIRALPFSTFSSLLDFSSQTDEKVWLHACHTYSSHIICVFSLSWLMFPLRNEFRTSRNDIRTNTNEDKFVFSHPHTSFAHHLCRSSLCVPVVRRFPHLLCPPGFLFPHLFDNFVREFHTVLFASFFAVLFSDITSHPRQFEC